MTSGLRAGAILQRRPAGQGKLLGVWQAPDYRRVYVVEEALTRNFDLTCPQEPVSPSTANKPWQHEIIPKVEQLIDVNEKADVLCSALPQDLFVHPSVVAAVFKIVCLRRPTPADVQGKLNRSRRFDDGGVVYILGQFDRPSERSHLRRPRKGHEANLTANAWDGDDWSRDARWRGA